MNRIIPRLLLPVIILFATVPFSTEGMQMESQKIHAPDFGNNMEWLNTTSEHNLSDFLGKVVILDFWTYCCINCQHVLPKLEALEEKYGDDLIVIGVHSAKFRNESETNNIRQAILRHNIRHLIVNDRDFAIWQQYGVQAWPTLVLIDPAGYLIAMQSGENAPEVFDPMIKELILSAHTSGTLDESPLKFENETKRAPTSILSFPSKIVVNDDEPLIYIADSNHNRIVVANLSSGKIVSVIGGKKAGNRDGSFENARFRHPQGLALTEHFLFVADTQNHTIRQVDFRNNTVATIAGTGYQGGYGNNTPKNALSTPLASPWDIEILDNKLFIAMAGPHQIWQYDFKDKTVSVFAGSGREDIIDGPRLRAALAQPSGLTSDNKATLFFADSEVSAIRGVSINKNSIVSTIVGLGLFDFGDRDGIGQNVLLQHPLGISWHNNSLYVADTYNNKIKQISPTYRSSKTYAGTGKEGIKDGSFSEATFDEPGGIHIGKSGTIYVADTNNHAIRILDPASKTVQTLALQPIANDSEINLGKKQPSPLEPLVIPNDTMQLSFRLKLPKGNKLNKEGGLNVQILANDSIVSLPVTYDPMSSDVFHTDISQLSNSFTLNISLSYTYCTAANKKLCYFDFASFAIIVSRDSFCTYNPQPIELPVSATN